MSSAPSYKCVNPQGLAALGRLATSYKKISTPQAITQAAEKAAGGLKERMQHLVQGESSLRNYQDVGQAFRVWSDKDNTYSGIHPDDPLHARAQQMDQIYSVSSAAQDLAQQSGEVEQSFLAELAAMIS